MNKQRLAKYQLKKILVSTSFLQCEIYSVKSMHILVQSLAIQEMKYQEKNL